MKMKLIVSLLALCLALSVVSVEAQTNVLGNMEDIDIIMTGNITETITCDIIGNAVMVEEMEFADNMTNATNNTNAAENMTFDVTGKVILIKDFGNMTEKAVIVGRAEDIPGNVVIFGEKENMTEGMDSTAGNMTNATEDMTVITTGNITGTIMFNTAEDMDNATGMNNMTEGMDNMTVLMTGNMAGTVKGDMTRRMVVIKNIGSVTEMSKTISNLTEMDMETANVTEPMTCDLTGKMVIIKNMDDMAVMDDEDIDDLIEMDGDTAIIETMDEVAGTDKGMDNVTGKIVIVRSTDDAIRIMTETVTWNATQNMATIEDMNGDMTEDDTTDDDTDDDDDMNDDMNGNTDDNTD